LTRHTSNILETFRPCRCEITETTNGSAGHDLSYFIHEKNFCLKGANGLTVDAIAAGTLAIIDMTGFKLSNMKTYGSSNHYFRTCSIPKLLTVANRFDKKAIMKKMRPSPKIIPESFDRPIACEALWRERGISHKRRIID